VSRLPKFHTGTAKRQNSKADTSGISGGTTYRRDERGRQPGERPTHLPDLLCLEFHCREQVANSTRDLYATKYTQEGMQTMDCRMFRIDIRIFHTYQFWVFPPSATTYAGYIVNKRRPDATSNSNLPEETNNLYPNLIQNANYHR